MKNIKIIVATHKKHQMPKDDQLYLPIHVGAEGKESIGYFRDDSGENISYLNPYYSELSGLYWAWKNLDYDYLGLVHYRRYFTKKRAKYTENVKLDEEILSQKDVEKLLEEADVLVPKKRKYYIETLYSHYDHTLDGSHLDKTREVIEEDFAEYLSAFDQVMKQRSGYMFNMFIMNRGLVEDYLSWLFPVLEKLGKKVDVEHLSPFEARLFGRVSELLFNVWLQKKKLRVKELPFMYFDQVDLFAKVKGFLLAKFFKQKYKKSF